MLCKLRKLLLNMTKMVTLLHIMQAATSLQLLIMKNNTT